MNLSFRQANHIQTTASRRSTQSAESCQQPGKVLQQERIRAAAEYSATYVPCDLGKLAQLPCLCNGHYPTCLWPSTRADIHRLPHIWWAVELVLGNNRDLEKTQPFSDSEVLKAYKGQVHSQKRLGPKLTTKVKVCLVEESQSESTPLSCFLKIYLYVQMQA